MMVTSASAKPWFAALVSLTILCPALSVSAAGTQAKSSGVSQPRAAAAHSSTRGRTAGAKGKSTWKSQAILSTPDRRRCYYYDGTRKREVWCDDTALAIVFRPGTAIKQDVLQQALTDAGIRGTIMQSGDTCAIVRTENELDDAERHRCARALTKHTVATTVSPVFYRSRRSNSRSNKAPRLLTNEIIVRVPRDWSAADLTAWAARHNVGAARSLGLDNIFVFTLNNGVASLDTVNSLHAPEDGVFACPNWLQTRVTKRLPINDEFGDALVITGESGVVRGANVDATIDFDFEPFHGGDFGGASIWYRWTAPRTGTVIFNTTGSFGFDNDVLDTLLGIYSGSSIATLDEEAGNDNNGSRLDSSASFFATAGVTYHIAIDGWSNDGEDAPSEGYTVLNWGYTPPNDTIAQAHGISGASGIAVSSSVGGSVEAGEPRHADTLNASVWFRWTAPESGQFAFDTHGSAIDTVIAAYPLGAVSAGARIAENDDCGSLQSRIVFSVTGGAGILIAVDGFGRATGHIVLNWRALDTAADSDDQLAELWHLRNTQQGNGVAGADINVAPLWGQRAGNGAVIAIVDNDFEIGHEDLNANVAPNLSRDFVDNDNNPLGPDDDPHGTAVAGLAAARGFNGTGVRGVAPEATLAGYRLLSGDRTVRLANEAEALTRNMQTIDIYNNSWGPADLVDWLDFLPDVTETALIDGVTNGRGGHGSVYTFAAGNGGIPDNSNYDGYANSRYTIAVTSSTNAGVSPDYAEHGANILVNAPSGGHGVGVTTTDRTGAPGYSATNYDCGFGGTSGATPIVSGVVALMLAENPTLSWRDVQHILAVTADQNDPEHTDWTVNSAGHPVNHFYGFGRVNATAAVAASRGWTSAGAELTVSQSSTPNCGGPIPDNDPAGCTDSVTITDDFEVEFVEVIFSSTDHPFWGDLEIELTAPSGTRSLLAETHFADSSFGYNAWRFGTVRHFGESSAGVWTLRAADRFQDDTGTFQTWTLKVYGRQDTDDAPFFVSYPVAAATEDIDYAYTITARDLDTGTTITVAAPVLPEWLAVTDTGNGTAMITGRPDNDDVGEHTIVLTATDNSGLVNTQMFTVTVANVNDAPDFTSTPVTAAIAALSYSYAIDTVDIDGDSLTVSATTKPVWLTVVEETTAAFVLQGTPTGSDVGDHAVTLRVEDPDGAFNEQSFAVTVSANEDSDGDGMQDAWECMFWDDTDEEADDDYDGDGFSNLQEFINDTDPTAYVLPMRLGWNLVSLAAFPPANPLDTVLATMGAPPVVWAWSAGRFRQASDLHALEGRWLLWTRPDQSIDIDDAPSNIPAANYDIPLRSGWNLISLNRVPFDNTAAEIFRNIAVASPIWTWNGTQYIAATHLEPLLGYWAYLNEPNRQVHITIVE